MVLNRACAMPIISIISIKFCESIIPELLYKEYTLMARTVSKKTINKNNPRKGCRNIFAHNILVIIYILRIINSL